MTASAANPTEVTAEAATTPEPDRPKDASDLAAAAENAVKDDGKLETYRPGAPESDGPSATTPDAVPAETEPTDQDQEVVPVPASNPTHVDPEVDEQVEQAIAFAQSVPEARAPTVSSAEIDISELGIDGAILVDEAQADEAADKAEARADGVPQNLPKATAYISDNVFANVPRAAGVVSVPPPDNTSSSSFKTIQTLIQLQELTGVSFRDLENLPDEEAAALRKVMLEASWPATEQQARQAIISVLQILEPRYRASTRWQNQGFSQVRQTFYQELKRKGGQLQKLAERLAKQPPPLPKPTGILSKDKAGKGT